LFFFELEFELVCALRHFLNHFTMRAQPPKWTASSTTSTDNESEMKTIPVIAVCLQRGSTGALGQRFEDGIQLFDLYLMANNKTAEQKKNAISLLEN
jgi:hypothetical protein